MKANGMPFCRGLAHMVQRASPMRLLETVIQPMFFSLNYRKNPQQTQDYFSLLLTLSFMVKIPVFAFFVCYHEQVVETIFAGRFTEYSYLLIPVFAFFALTSIASPVTLVAQLQERAPLILASRIFGIYNIVALLVLIPRMGVLGAVVATGTATLMKNLFVWWFVRDIGQWKQAPRFLTHSLIVWGLFVLINLRVMPSIGGAAIHQLIAGVLLWVGFCMVYLRMGALTHKQRLMIGRLFPGRETKLLRLAGLAA